jgi:hypothetical protein
MLGSSAPQQHRIGELTSLRYCGLAGLRTVVQYTASREVRSIDSQSATATVSKSQGEINTVADDRQPKPLSWRKTAPDSSIVAVLEVKLSAARFLLGSRDDV